MDRTGHSNPERNPLYVTAGQVHPSHWEALERRPPEEAAAAAGADWDGEKFRLTLLGHALYLVPAERAVIWADRKRGEVGYQRGLVAIVCLGRAIPAEPQGRWVAFRELPGGEAFFRGPHSLATPELESAFGDDPEGLVRAAGYLGGSRGEGSEWEVCLAALPHIPLKVILWPRSEEFGAAANLLTDARAHLHLPLDVLWALSNLAIADLVRG